MSEEWDWKLTDRSKRQLDALDEHARDRIISNSKKSSPTNGGNQRTTLNHSRGLHIRNFELDSSASDVVPIVNNEHSMWSRSENGVETHTEATIEIRTPY